MTRLRAIKLLEKHGHAVTLAANGKKAVDASAAGSEFKLILMEVQMSEVSGFGAATGFPPRWLGGEGRVRDGGFPKFQMGIRTRQSLPFLNSIEDSIRAGGWPRLKYLAEFSEDTDICRARRRLLKRSSFPCAMRPPRLRAAERRSENPVHEACRSVGSNPLQ